MFAVFLFDDGDIGKINYANLFNLFCHFNEVYQWYLTIIDLLVVGVCWKIIIAVNQLSFLIRHKVLVKLLTAEL